MWYRCCCQSVLHCRYSLPQAAWEGGTRHPVQISGRSTKQSNTSGWNINRFFSFILVRRKTVFSFQQTENHVLCFTSPVFMEHFLPTFCTLCEENESLAVRPYFDPPLGQGWGSAHVQRKDLNCKEVAGQTHNILAGAAEKFCAHTVQLYLRWMFSFPKCTLKNASKVFKKYK